MRIWAVVAGLPFVLIGCAGAKVALPQPDPAAQAELERLFTSPIETSRGIPVQDRHTVVDRIDRRILPAAVRVCQLTFNDPQNCEARINGRSLIVESRSEAINASVGDRYNLTLLGGLVREAGSDDEIALVLAHEYSHALFGHVSQTQNNSIWGELAAGLAGLALIAANADTISDDQIETIAMGSTEIGAAMGQTVFSKDMELEADHLALFMLAEAGYDLDKGMQFFRRTLEIQHQMNVAGRNQVVGFFATHPSDEERLLQLLATKDLIARGVTRPIWKQ